MNRIGSNFCRTNQSAFTLIEIMAVVLLLGLALSGVSANLNRFVPSTQSESAARSIVGDLDLARSAAIANGRPYVMEVDLDQHSYRIITPFNEDGRIARTVEERTDLGIKVLPKGISFGGMIVSGNPERLEAGLHQVPFPHTGIMNDLVFFLSNSEGPQFDLTIFMGALTGKTLVIEGEFESSTVTDADF